jgi:hypothetical protein
VNIAIETNLPQLEALWAQSPTICTEELTTSMYEALALLERETIELTPRGATGTLRNMITTSLTGLASIEGDIVGLVTGTAPHTVPVEMGSRPHYVPIAPLIDWVAAKLGKTGEEGEEIAYRIRSRIRKYGTKGKAMFRRVMQVNHNERRVEQILQAALPRIAARLMPGDA